MFLGTAIKILRFFDELGLKVVGVWINPPRITGSHIRIDRFERISPYWSWWGFIKTVRVFGHPDAAINMDVKCADQEPSSLKEWEIHRNVKKTVSGHFDRDRMFMLWQ